MAIVKSGTASNGARWRIHDDAYIHNTPEQSEALRRKACDIAHGILLRYAAEQGGKNHADNGTECARAD